MLNVSTLVVDATLHAALEDEKAVRCKIQRHPVHCLCDPHLQLIQAVDWLPVHQVLHPTHTKTSIGVRSGLRAGQ